MEGLRDLPADLHPRRAHPDHGVLLRRRHQGGVQGRQAEERPHPQLRPGGGQRGQQEGGDGQQEWEQEGEKWVSGMYKECCVRSQAVTESQKFT